MIRPFTCLCLAAACGSGLYLYSEKHRTAMLDRDISGLIHATEAARARTGLLRAEWALLNEPGRLQDMAGKYTVLQPMAPTQFVQLADLSNHLPPPETAAESAAEAAGTTDDDSDGAALVATAAPPAADAPPASDKPASDKLAAAAAPPPAIAGNGDPQQAPREAARQLAHADARQKPTHRAALAERPAPLPHDGMLAHSTPLPLAAPQPVSARVYSTLAHAAPLSAPRPQVVSAVPHFVTPYVGSALAGRASLPPPVPYGGDQ